MEKKVYKKPTVFFEQFELTKHIADCAWELTNSTKDTCSAAADSEKLPGFPNLFMNEENGCIYIPGVNYEVYCYHDGAQGMNVFAS